MSNNINNTQASDIECPLRVGTLNVRGFLSRKKRKVLINNFKREKLDIVGIQEAHLANQSEVSDLERQWKGTIHNCPCGLNRSKGVATMFRSIHSKEDTKVLYSSPKGTILISSLKIQGELFYIINGYSPCEEKEKLSFLREIYTAINTYVEIQEDTNIICLGDFNISLSQLDIISGRLHKASVRDAFNNFILGQNLVDSWRMVHPEEKIFTWSKVNPPVAKRLDYILVSESLAAYVSESTVKSVTFTDHRLVVTNFIFSTFKTGKGLFKMNTTVLKDREYCEIINNEIQKTREEFRNVNPHLLLEMIKINVKEITQIYCRMKKRESIEREVELRKKLQEMEEEMIRTHSSSSTLLRNVAKVKSELEIIELRAAKGAQIRSCMQEINDGEKCTKYFLSMEKHRSNINTIKSLTDSNGVRLKDEQRIVEEIGKNFEKRYNRPSKSREFVCGSMDRFLNNVHLPALDEEEKLNLEADITMEEVSQALKGMKHGSAPGSDGLPVEFYKVFWQNLRDPLMKCYMYSFEQSELAPSERLGVISLFHKGSELAADNLNNWRPISLTNVDYKILAKVLSRRLDKVIDKLIGMQQVGFMKGRNIALIHRQIDDLLNIQRRNNAAGILLAIDFKQAFDAINIDCIINSLKTFGFGHNFIKWIKILNTNRLACVKNGGHISDTFNMTNGVRQGCPISPQLFLLAVEILAQKIIQDPEIKGLNPHQSASPKKIEQYADDTSLYLRDTDDLKRALAHLREFSIFSDLHLNLSKCFALSTNGAPVDIGDIPIQFKNSIKILGIYFSHLFPARYLELNWVERMERVRRILGKWQKRSLTLIGKLHVIKTYGISQFVFIMKSIGLSSKTLKDINFMFYSFLWKKKMDNKKPSERIRRSVLCSRYNTGGLQMIDMEKLQDSIMLEWAESLINTETSEWKDLALFHFKQLGGRVAFKSKVTSGGFKGLEVIGSMFWRDVLVRWLDFANKGISRGATSFSLNDPIANNKHIQFKGELIYLPSCLTRGVITIGDMIQQGRLLTFGEFEVKYGVHNRSLLDFNVLKNALNKVLHKVHMRDQPMFLCRGKAVGKLGRKYFYNCIISDFSTDSPLCVGLWQRKYGVVVGKEHWRLVHQLKETRLKVLAWKVLHNIYPTGISLSKMGLSSENCKYCNVLDTLEHFFFFCIKVKPLWNAIQSDIQAHLNKHININERIVIFGPVLITNLGPIKLERINQIITIGKMVISKFKYGPQRNIIEIYETDCALRKIWDNTYT